MEQGDADLHDMLQAGIAEAKAKRKTEAYLLLKQVVTSDPQSEQGWLWLAPVAPTPAESLDAFEHVLTINPSNQQAVVGRRWALSRLNIPTDESAPAATPAPLPPAAPPPLPPGVGYATVGDGITPPLPDTMSATYAPTQKPRTTAPLVMPEPLPAEGTSSEPVPGENGSLVASHVAEPEIPAPAQRHPTDRSAGDLTVDSDSADLDSASALTPSAPAGEETAVDTLRPVGRRGSLVPLLLGALLLIIGALLAVTGLFGGSGYFDDAGTKFFQAQIGKNYTAAAGYLAPDLRQKYYAAQNDLPAIKLNQALAALTSPAVQPGKPLALAPDGNQGETIVTITFAPAPVSYLVRLTKSGSSWLITGVSAYPAAP
ncbi:MAG: hypothetical protein ACR2M0_03445 [Chloroflexia bacterium]